MSEDLSKERLFTAWAQDIPTLGFVAVEVAADPEYYEMLRRIPQLHPGTIDLLRVAGERMLEQHNNEVDEI